MDHLQNVLSYFDQQQPLCAEHDRIPKDLYREFGVKAGLRAETGKGVLAGLTNISDIRAFQYVDGVKHPADGQLLYRGYDVKDLINGSRGSRFAFEEAGYLLLFGQLPTPEQLEQFCAVLGAFIMTSRVKLVGMVRHSPSTAQNCSSCSGVGSAPNSSR